MTKKSKKKQKKSRDKVKWEQERNQFNQWQSIAPRKKAQLRKLGCDLPFYDYLDSYSKEFTRVAELAQKKHPTLLGIHEVEDDIYYDIEKRWADLGYGHLEQIFFNIGSDAEDYGNKHSTANIEGVTAALLDEQGNLNTVVILRKSINCSFRFAEYKYSLKIVALHHEIGHVTDLEQGLNFDVKKKQANIIEAEIYAHLYALNRLAERHMKASFEMLHDALQELRGVDGYLGEVAAAVLEKMPEHQIIDWQSCDS